MLEVSIPALKGSECPPLDGSARAKGVAAFPSAELSQGPARSLGNTERRRQRTMRKGTTALHAVPQRAVDRSISVLGDSAWQRGAGWRKVRPARLRARECTAN